MAIVEKPAEITVTLRGIEPKERVKEYALDKLEKKIRLVPNLRAATVEVTFEHTRPKEKRYCVQVTASADGSVLRVEDRGADTFTTIDAVHDLLERRVRDWKGRVYFERRRETAAIKEAVIDETTRLRKDDQTGRIVRMKSHEIKPSFPEDAIDEMEMLGHDFFFFLNADTGQYNVVYRRKVGGYGLIEPALPRLGPAKEARGVAAPAGAQKKGRT